MDRFYGKIKSENRNAERKDIHMTIEEMKNRKRELGYSYEQIAELSGLPLGTVQKGLGGITRAPRYDTLQALERVLARKADDILGEAESVYGAEKQQGEYTLEDYYALPEERRVEMIDGVFYDMASPSNIHQLISGEIFRSFSDFIRKKEGKCIAAYAPLDVQLDCNDRTIVQPDVMIVCDRKKFQRGLIYGAPDLVVEILSKTTKRKDNYTKLMKYAVAGVREYWIVDPERKKVVVYDLENEEYPVIYGFSDMVPVRIFSGECRVNFSAIDEYICFLYESDQK